MQKFINVFLILSVISLGVVVFLQYRAIIKLTPAPNPGGAFDTTDGRKPAEDWIDQLSRSAKALNIEVKY